MEFVRMWILNIVSVIVIVSFLEIILPENGMKKFIHLALGFIIILVVITPVVEMFNKDIDVEEAIYTYTSDINRHEYVFNTQNMEEKQNDQLLGIYKDKVKADVKYRVESKYDVEVKDIKLDVETEDKESIGNILGLKIVLSERPLEGETIPIVQIDVSTQEEEITKTEIEPQIKESISEDISSIYNLQDKNVVVSE